MRTEELSEGMGWGLRSSGGEDKDEAEDVDIYSGSIGPRQRARTPELNSTTRRQY